jgi:FkbM family methyltransferase
VTRLPKVCHHDDQLQRIWRWSAPVRAYARRSPVRKGRWFLARRLVLPRFPSTGRFTVLFADGSRVELDYGEALGWSVLACGRFEQAERDWLTRRARGSVAIDVGANVGWHAVGMAAVGATVIAVEPLEANLLRLREAVADHPAIVIEATALGARPGRVRHTAPADGAYVAVDGEPLAADAGLDGASTWPMTTLDALWERHGAPPVRVVKIDVEGYELEVLRGGRQLLANARPDVLVETTHPAAVAELFAGLGYRELPRPPGFAPGNHVFGAASAPVTSSRIAPRDAVRRPR